MREYLDLLSDVRQNGTLCPTRAILKSTNQAVQTYQVFGRQIRFDLSRGFPLVTTKKVYWKGVVHELLWFLKGDTNVQYLQDNGVHIWNEWARSDGSLGPVYGGSWRHWGANAEDGDEGVDQISALMNELKHKPHSRRLIVSAWNVKDLPEMQLPPCHLLWQLNVTGHRLDLMMTMRSADIFLGVPFNIASYALLLTMIAKVAGYAPGELIVSFGNLHIYENHMEAVDEQLTRKPYPLPRVQVDPAVTSIFDFRYDSIKLLDYQSHPALHAEVAV